MSKTILFFGNERLATGVSTNLPIVRGLIAKGYAIRAIIVSQEGLSSTDQPEIIDFAKSQNIEILNPKNLKDFAITLANYRPDAAVLAAYGKIIPNSILDLFPMGIINIHPSLLPRHRGPTPIESVMLAGEETTGVSIMRLASSMDAGPVYAQSELKLVGNETKQILADSLGSLGAQMLQEYIDGILNGKLRPQNQSTSDVTYDKLINKNDGIVDWKQPADQIERQIRAYSGWPKSKTRLKDIDITIIKAHAAPGSGQAGTVSLDNNELVVFAGSGKLHIDALVPAGKKMMSAESFLAGYRQRF